MSKVFLTIFIGLMGLITTPADLQAATIYVPDQYKTINEAVKNASVKDTIIVRDGDYRENIVITKPLIIKSSSGHDAAIIHALISTEPVFKISNTNDVTIIGFTATGSLLAGIYLLNADNGQLIDNKTVNNGNGILLYSSHNNTLANNTASSNEQYGIYLELSRGNTLEKNTVNSNRDKGVFLSLANHNNLINNTVNLNAWDGIILWSSHSNVLKDNRAFRNRYAIVLNNSNDNALINNSTWSNIYIILPVVLIYIGIIVYLIQKNFIRFIYRE